MHVFHASESHSRKAHDDSSGFKPSTAVSDCRNLELFVSTEMQMYLTLKASITLHIGCSGVGQPCCHTVYGHDLKWRVTKFI